MMSITTGPSTRIPRPGVSFTTTKRKAKRRGTCRLVRARPLCGSAHAPTHLIRATQNHSVRRRRVGRRDELAGGLDGAQGRSHQQELFLQCLNGMSLRPRSRTRVPWSNIHTLSPPQGKTSWEKPSEGAAGAGPAPVASALPAGWTEHFDAPSNKTFYYNASTVRTYVVFVSWRWHAFNSHRNGTPGDNILVKTRRDNGVAEAGA